MPSKEKPTQVSSTNQALNQAIVLPEPSIEDVAHSQKLVQWIIDDIDKHGGAISFEQYMQHALYAPGLGYYSAGSRKFGAEGDFITAPEISSIFGQVLAIQAEQVLSQVRKIQQTGKSTDILEFGAGSGKLALEILLALDEINCLPDHYFILDLSADLIERQKILLKSELAQRHKSEIFKRIHWLTQLPESFDGLMLANEVLDAIPTRLIKIVNEQLLERFVGYDEKLNQFGWTDIKTDDESLQRSYTKIKQAFEQGLTAHSFAKSTYITEVNTQSNAWIKSLANVLNSGAILLIDYGYTDAEYFHPQRNTGTLMCHYRHHSHDDPLYLPGLQDITAHVNFSEVNRTARENGLELLGFTTQAHFLISGGLQQLSEQFDMTDHVKMAELSRQIKMLTLPNEMGELFKAICFSKQLEQGMSGFDFINMQDKL